MDDLRALVQAMTGVHGVYFQADIAGLRRDYPKIHLTSLEEWLSSEGWENKKTIAVKRDRIGR